MSVIDLTSFTNFIAVIGLNKNDENWYEYKTVITYYAHNHYNIYKS